MTTQNQSSLESKKINKKNLKKTNSNKHNYLYFLLIFILLYYTHLYKLILNIQKSTVLPLHPVWNSGSYHHLYALLQLIKLIIFTF